MNTTLEQIHAQQDDLINQISDLEEDARDSTDEFHRMETYGKILELNYKLFDLAHEARRVKRANKNQFWKKLFRK